VSLKGHALVCLSRVERSRDSYSNVYLGKVEGSFESHTLLMSPPLGVQTGLKDIMGLCPYSLLFWCLYYFMTNFLTFAHGINLGSFRKAVITGHLDVISILTFEF
jgi:hypothetical protein